VGLVAHLKLGAWALPEVSLACLARARGGPGGVGTGDRATRLLIAVAIGAGDRAQRFGGIGGASRCGLHLHHRVPGVIVMWLGREIQRWGIAATRPASFAHRARWTRARLVGLQRPVCGDPAPSYTGCC